ncbi:MAG: hypothetical protein WB660_05890 [Candidatus Sulfotelmatobacter sp.]
MMLENASCWHAPLQPVRAAQALLRRAGIVWFLDIEIKRLAILLLQCCSAKWKRFHFVVKAGLKDGNKTSMQVPIPDWQQPGGGEFR